MRAPHTYTREDVVEINCHGGLLATNRILQLTLCHGRPTSWKLIGKSCSCCVKTIQKSNYWSLVRKTVLLIQLNSG
ncbi:hypothetical protein, partial [Bacteroides cellulosilyticus]|uniref:hypothetical protein n=1 Tax=Bacteroides cellulosilyticus TaxID=246787 RepID=UPI00272F9813